MFASRKFFTCEFLAKITENPSFFQRASVTSSHFPGQISHVWHLNAGYGMECETLVAFSFKPEIFWFFHKILAEIFLEKSFRIIFCIIWSLAHSACLKVMNITWIDNILSNVYSSEFSCKFWLRANFFSWIYCRKLSKNRFPSPLSTLPKTFSPFAQTIKANWASWRQLDCLRSSQEFFRVRSVVDSWSGQGTL